MKTTFKPRQQIYTLLICLFILTTVGVRAGVVSVEEFFHVAISSKKVVKAFSFNLRDRIEGTSHCSKYIAARNANTIDIFDSKGIIHTIPAKAFPLGIKGFLEKKNRFFAFKQMGNGEYNMGIFEMDGTLIKTIPFTHIRFFPSGEYFYSLCSMEHSGPIYIYDNNCEVSFKIPTTSECQDIAPSDSQFIVLHHKSLSLWDVNTKQKLWEIDIPREDFYTESIYKISYSTKGNIIIVRDMFGIYCFDFQGNFLWSKDGLKVKRDIVINGVSKENGMVVITNNLDVGLFDREGNLLEEIKGDYDKDTGIASNYGHEADVFSELILIRFFDLTVVGDKTQKKRVTAIFYHDGKGWIRGVIEGSWYLLDNEEGIKTLIGFDSESNVVSAYTIK